MFWWQCYFDGAKDKCNKPALEIQFESTCGFVIDFKIGSIGGEVLLFTLGTEYGIRIGHN